MSRHNEVRQPVEVPERIMAHLGAIVAGDLDWMPKSDGSVLVQRKSTRFVEIASLPIEKQAGVLAWLRKTGRIEERVRVVGDARLGCGHPDSPENLIKVKEPGQREGRETMLCLTCNQEKEHGHGQ